MRIVSPSLALLAMASTVPAQDPASVFPSSTYAVVRFSGLQELQESASSQALLRLVHNLSERMDPEARQEILGQGMEEMAREISGFLREMRLSPQDAKAVLDGPIAVAIGRPVIFDDEMVPSVAVAIGGGQRGEQARRIMTTFEQRMTDRDVLSASDAEGMGVPARIIRHRDISGEVVHGMIGSVGVLTNSPGLFAECVEQSSSGTQATSAGSLASVFINTKVLEPMFPLVQSFLPYGFEDLFPMLGVEGLDGIRMESRVDGEGCLDSFEIGMKGSKDGLFKTLMADPADLGAARYCGEDTVLFSAMSLDCMGLVASIERIMSALPKQVRDEAHREMEREMRRELGMSPQQLHGLVSAFGKNVSFAVETYRNQLIPTVTLFVEVADQGTVADLLAGIEGETQTEWKELSARKEGDVPIRYTALQMDDVSIRPGYAFHEGRLILCSDVTKLRAAVRRATSGEGTLAGVESFQRETSRFSKAGMIVHSRMDRGAELGWPMAEGPLRALLDSDDAQRMGLHSGMVPEVEEVAAALGTGTFAVTVSGDGIRVEQRSHLGLGTLLCMLGVAVGETLDSISPEVR